MKVPGGMACRARTPHPILAVLYSCSRTLGGEKEGGFRLEGGGVHGFGVHEEKLGVFGGRVEEFGVKLRDLGSLRGALGDPQGVWGGGGRGVLGVHKGVVGKN